MKKLDEADVRKLARLSRLSLSDEEVKHYQNELTAILSYVEQLSAADVEGLEPTIQVTGNSNVVRADEVSETISPKELLKNAPASEDNQFKVQRVL